ncbi:phage major capsid protein [Cupriavidus campinensis]
MEKGLAKVSDQVKEWGEKAIAEAQKAGELSKKTREAVDEVLIKHNELAAEVRDMEKKMVERKGSEPERQKSLGEQIVESDTFKRYVENGKQGSMKIELKAVTSANAGALIRPLYETEPVSLPKRRFTIRDLLPVVPIQTSSVDYPKQSTRTNTAYARRSSGLTALTLLLDLTARHYLPKQQRQDLTFRSLADKHGGSPATLFRAARWMDQNFRKLETLAIERLEPLFIAHGIVPDRATYDSAQSVAA